MKITILMELDSLEELGRIKASLPPDSVDSAYECVALSSEVLTENRVAEKPEARGHQAETPVSAETKNDASRGLKIKPLRKPKGGPRAPRAMPNENPGECVECAQADYTKDGWFCKPENRALGLEAKACVNFFSRMAEPSAEPHAKPSAEPHAEPHAEPSAEPHAEPHAEPSAEPSAEPHAKPSADPDAFFDADPPAKDSKALRLDLQRACFACIPHDAIASRVTDVIRQFSTSGLIKDVKENKLNDAIQGIKALLKEVTP